MAKTGFRRGDLAGIAGGWLPLPYSLLDSPAYQSLSTSAVKLLFDVYRQYTGRNNGAMSPSWELMKERGWRSKTTLTKAKEELRASRIITVTRVGTRGPEGDAELWAVNWMKMDYRPDFDIGPKAQDYMGFIKIEANPVAEQDRRKLRLVETALKAAKKTA